MIRTLSRFLFPLSLVILPLIATAAPGSSLTAITVKPQDAPKVVAAIDAFMSSPVGQQFKGRLRLQAHVADGADPATHSILSHSHSAAEAEAFGNASRSEPAWAKLMETLTPISEVTFTGMATTVRSWGDINDTDTVWHNFMFSVTDAPAFMAALEAWIASPKGKSLTGQAHLFAVLAGGTGPVTHVISVGSASMEEAEASRESNANDPDWRKYITAMQPTATLVGRTISRSVKVWGPATMASLAPKP